jgi:uncharacterized protein with PIN domain
MIRLLRPDARCPKCKKPPSIRVPDDMRDAACSRDRDGVAMTYQCHRCGTIYEIKASDICRAA